MLQNARVTAFTVLGLTILDRCENCSDDLDDLCFADQVT